MREYVRPVALVDEFVANSYVAACNNSIAEGNEMKCINPEHGHSNMYQYTFASVWVEAATSSCDIKVNANSPKTEGYGDAVNWWPEKGTYVYSLNGPLQCNQRRYDGVGAYVPDVVLEPGKDSPCYGAYVYDGSFTASVIS